MKTAFWQASLTASQAGENSQTNGLEHTIKLEIQCSNRPDPQENRGGRMILSLFDHFLSLYTRNPLLSGVA
jgi:hypothetical protein